MHQQQPRACQHPTAAAQRQQAAAACSRVVTQQRQQQRQVDCRVRAPCSHHQPAAPTCHPRQQQLQWARAAATPLRPRRPTCRPRRRSMRPPPPPPTCRLPRPGSPTCRLPHQATRCPACLPLTCRQQPWCHHCRASRQSSSGGCACGCSCSWVRRCLLVCVVNSWSPWCEGWCCCVWLLSACLLRSCGCDSCVLYMCSGGTSSL